MFFFPTNLLLTHLFPKFSCSLVSGQLLLFASVQIAFPRCCAALDLEPCKKAKFDSWHFASLYGNSWKISFLFCILYSPLTFIFQGPLMQCICLHLRACNTGTFRAFSAKTKFSSMMPLLGEVANNEWFV